MVVGVISSLSKYFYNNRAWHIYLQMITTVTVVREVKMQGIMGMKNNGIYFRLGLRSCEDRLKKCHKDLKNV